MEIGNIISLLYRLEMKLVKGSGSQPRLCFHSQTGNFYHPSGISFVKTVKGILVIFTDYKQKSLVVLFIDVILLDLCT